MGTRGRGRREERRRKEERESGAGGRAGGTARGDEGWQDKVRERERKVEQGVGEGRKRSTESEPAGERRRARGGRRRRAAAACARHGCIFGLLPLAVARHPRAPHPCSVRRCPSPAPPDSVTGPIRERRGAALFRSRDALGRRKCRRYRSPFVVPSAVRLADDSARAPCVAPFLQERERHGRIVSARGRRIESEREGERRVRESAPVLVRSHVDVERRSAAGEQRDVGAGSFSPSRRRRSGFRDETQVRNVK